MAEGIVEFDGLKIDGRRVQRERDKSTGIVSNVEGFLSGAGGGSPEDVAREFLDANYRFLTGRRTVLNQLEKVQESRSPAGYHVTLQQTVKGVPVEEATISVHMTQDKRVHGVRSHLKPQAVELDVQAMAKDGIDSEEAITIAVADVGADDDLLSPPSAEHVVFAGDDPRLAWKISFSTVETVQDWIIHVDALTGDVLDRRKVSV
jgi:Zn-dependent metalloprotease